jgi:bifunctional DNA-binding transcriptional regulator/antitoxin component of YhaV-PrlF toxin-antitoxin module
MPKPGSPPDVSDLIPRKIDPQNRIVLPPEILEALGAKKGDYLGYELSRDGVRLHLVRIERVKRASGGT